MRFTVASGADTSARRANPGLLPAVPPEIVGTGLNRDAETIVSLSHGP